MHLRPLTYLALCSVTVAAAAAACSATRRPTGFTETDGIGGAGGHSSGQGAGTLTGSGGLDLDGGFTGAGGACGVGCSADLKKVIDCSGQVLAACKDDEGCANGKCINDPCLAAEVSKSSYGCDYWSVKPDLISDGQGACFAAFLANTWSSPVHITVEYQGQVLPSSAIRIPKGQGQALSYGPYDAVTGLPAGEVAILFLSREPGGSFMPDCPSPPALTIETGILGTGRGTGFHFVTDRPVVAYQMLPFGGGSSAATSATLLLPTSAWDTNYIAVNAFEQSVIVPGSGPSLDILAKEDGTQVTILPKATILAGPNVAGSGAGQPVTYSLNRGEYIQFTQPQELTGSPVQSNKPIAMWGGASVLNVPVDAFAADSAHQQIPPVKALGSEYAGVRYRGRTANPNEAPPWRVVGAVAGTQLTWTPGPPNGAPLTLELGDVYTFNAAGPFVVASQDAAHPFYFAGYMTGGGDFGGEGDPEWVNVVPTAQYLDSYVFFTDPTYSETNLVVVRKPGVVSGKFADVNLDCAGTLVGWQPLGPYEYTRIDLVTGNFQNVGNCSNGRHEMKSDQPFGLTVWGWGTIPGNPGQGDLFTQYVSYAYPAGASVQSINEVVVPPVPQ